MATIHSDLNFTRHTDAGAIDLFGDIAGGGTFESLFERTIEVEAFGVRCRCLDLDALIQTKRAAGRPRDLQTVAELEIIAREARGHRENDVAS